jgi:hypothetical protein
MSEGNVLSALADRINDGFRHIESARVQVGLWLIEARTRVEKSGQLWTHWVKHNIDRCMRDVQRCMALAKSDDPEAAAAAERATNRAAAKAYRARNEAADRQSPFWHRVEGTRTAYSGYAPGSDAGLWHAKGPVELGITTQGKAPSHYEWYTPEWIFKAMGSVRFSIDVCSPGADKVPHIPADKHYTKKENGLQQPWHGLVFMNPPFGTKNGFDDWLHKFVAHANGVALAPMYTNVAAFREFLKHVDCMLLLDKRIKFIDGTTGKTSKEACVFGITLSAMGPQAVAVLETAHRNGLGGLMYSHRYVHQSRLLQAA